MSTKNDLLSSLLSAYRESENYAEFVIAIGQIYHEISIEYDGEIHILPMPEHLSCEIEKEIDYTISKLANCDMFEECSILKKAKNEIR